MAGETTPSRSGRPGQGKALGRRYRGGDAARRTSTRRPGKPSASFGARLRYRLDNALSRSAWVVIGYLGLITLVIVFLAAAVSVVANLIGFGGGSEPFGLLESFWQMLVRVVDAGSFAGDATWPTRLLALVVTLSGIFIAGSLIGLISSAVDQRVDALRRGRSNVVERGHTLILGWSSHVPTIVQELVIANESEKHAAIVILADRDKTEMEEAIRAAVGDLRSTSVVGRRGDPARMSDLELVSAPEARSILVMSGEDGDAGAIKTALAVLGLRLEVPVIVEMTSATQADSLEAVTGGAVMTVNSDRLIAEVTAQACHERGLSHVFGDLLDFSGDEIYFREFPQLVGATFAQVQQSFERAAVMGLATAEAVLLNPPADRRIAPGDRVIALCEDDSRFIATGPVEPPIVPVAEEADPEPPQHILLVGWSALGPRVVQELDEFLPPGSEVTLLVDPELVSPAPSAEELPVRNSSIEVMEVADGPERMGDFLGDERYDQGILLGYRQGISAADADARTLLTLMALRRRWPKDPPPAVRLVAEVLDQRNVPIAQLAGVDDFIVSDQLASLMLAQLSENLELRAVFDELFDASGASIVLRPARRYAPNGSATFAEILAAGNRFGESAIGCRVGGRVRLNPGRNERLTLAADDEVIALTTRG